MTRDFQHIEEKFKEHLQYVDDTALLVLKGHLLIEEALDSIIEKFLFHPKFFHAASLRFPQKVGLARALSLDEYNNDTWSLAIALNTLRNELAHSLKHEKRQNKLQSLRTIYYRQVGDAQDEKFKDPELPDEMIIYWSVALLLGYLDSFLEEAKRYRNVVDEMDRVMNPHRHGLTPEKVIERFNANFTDSEIEVFKVRFGIDFEESSDEEILSAILKTTEEKIERVELDAAKKTEAKKRL